MANKIRAMFIFEMLGKPVEFVKESMEEHIKSLEIEGVKILNKNIHEPKPMEKEAQKGLFITFAEVEMEFDNLNLLFGISFRMLPSHVEIIDPSELNLKNFDLSAILTDLAIKLHKYDEIAKILTFERNHIAKQIGAYKAKYGELVNVSEVAPMAEDKNKKNKKPAKKKK